MKPGVSATQANSISTSSPLLHNALTHIAKTTVNHVSASDVEALALRDDQKDIFLHRVVNAGTVGDTTITV